MARTVTWTASAVNNLDQIAEFIAKDSRFYAITVVRKARDLATFFKHDEGVSSDEYKG